MAEVRADQRANVDNSFGFAGAELSGTVLWGGAVVVPSH